MIKISYTTYHDPNTTIPHPTLRLRKINELQKNPDWVLVLDELNQTELSNNGSSI